MTRIFAAALFAFLGVVPASAETIVDATNDPTSCGSRLNRPISIPSSTGHVTYISVNTRTSFCIPTGDLNDPAFVGGGGDSSGSTSSDSGTGEGCGGEGSGPK
jgi:hypothetical protein